MLNLSCGCSFPLNRQFKKILSNYKLSFQVCILFIAFHVIVNHAHVVLNGSHDSVVFYRMNFTFVSVVQAVI